MKVLLGAVAVTLLITTPVAAQTTPTTPAPPATFTSACAALPPAPTLPDGATADREAMAAGNVALASWSERYGQVMACRRAEVQELRARSEASIVAFNAAAEVLNAADPAWQAEVAEFNARGARRAN